MPLICIEIVKRKDSIYKKTLLDAAHTSLITAIHIADWDRFQRLYEIDNDCFERSEEQLDKLTMI